MGSQVILATAGYDHTIKLWEATSGICYRTLQYADSQARGCTPRHASRSAPAHKRQMWLSCFSR